MALEAGSCKKGTGLAGLMGDYLTEAVDGFNRVDAAAGIDAQAKAIVEYIVANAEIETEQPLGCVQVGPDPIPGVLK